MGGYGWNSTNEKYRCLLLGDLVFGVSESEKIKFKFSIENETLFSQNA